jgi:hypothetical protein
MLRRVLSDYARTGGLLDSSLHITWGASLKAWTDRKAFRWKKLLSWSRRVSEYPSPLVLMMHDCISYMLGTELAEMVSHNY